LSVTFFALVVRFEVVTGFFERAGAGAFLADRAVGLGLTTALGFLAALGLGGGGGGVAF